MRRATSCLALLLLVSVGSAQGASFQRLGDLPGRTFLSMTWDVSADGSVVVGRSVSEFGEEAFRWTEAEGMLGLSDLPDGWFQSDALAVSADGSVVVGFGNSSADTEAFRWNRANDLWTERNINDDFGLTGYTTPSIDIGSMKLQDGNVGFYGSIPQFGDLPLIGFFFTERPDGASDDLLIYITAQIIDPTDP